MRIVTAFNKKVCVGVFAILFTSSIGYMLGSLHSVEILEEKAKLTDKLNQAELELFEAERQLVHCDSELGHKMNAILSENSYKTIHVITPTYTRKTQLAELTLLAQALAHIPYLQWIVLEVSKTDMVVDFLEKTNLQYKHLDSGGKVKSGNMCNALRNIALDYLTENSANSSGVILFANLDRTYSSELFEKVRDIETVGIWPTVFAKEQFTCDPLKFNMETPKYPINLGSVGFNSTALLNTSRRFDVNVSDTQGISSLVEGLVSSNDDIKVISCDGQYVWYTPIF